MVAVDKRVLVVDDEQVVRDSCERVLRDAGYVVQTVASGRDALAACRAHRFDVMFTDLRMPDMDGLEITRAMASEFPETRVIVITGYPSRESAEQAKRLGVFDYLRKPLSPGRLAEATAEVLAHPPRFSTLDLPPLEPGIETFAATPTAEPCKRVAPGALEGQASRPLTVTGPESVPAEPEDAEEPDISTMKAACLLAAAPLAGLALVVFLPLIGFGMLLTVVGSKFGLNLGRSR